MRVVQYVVLLSDIETAGFDDERSIELRRLPAGALLTASVFVLHLCRLRARQHLWLRRSND